MNEMNQNDYAGLSPEQQARLQELERAVEESQMDPELTEEAVGAQVSGAMIEAAAQRAASPIDPDHAEVIRRSAEAFAQQQQAQILQQTQGQEPSNAARELPITPAEMARIVQESRELLLTQSARDYIQDQTAQIAAEIRELRLSGISVTREEVEAVMNRALAERRDPADVFRQYAYERLKNRFVYGNVDDPNPARFFRQSENHQPAAAQSGYQPPDWMRPWLERQQENSPLRNERTIEPPDFELFLRDFMAGRF